MIVSHEHKFIFVKTRKTAGTSIEVALSALAGEDAIVTPVMPPESLHQPRNWQGLFNPMPELFEHFVRREPSLARWTARTTLVGLRRRRRFYNHLPVAVIRARLGAKIWDEYFTFCFERNPWDKAISWYFWQTRGDASRVPFEQWISRTALPVDWKNYTIGGSIAVDFVGQFENLNDDLDRALAHVGLTDVPRLPRAKGQFRPADPDAPITRVVDERVRQCFANEIRQFGYTRPTPSVT